MNGFINLDKPAGISSARAVAGVKRLLPRGTRIGHAGTLDPFATGVLVLLVGKATRSCETLMDQPKQYEATIKLGAITPTGDPDSPEEPFVPIPPGGITASAGGQVTPLPRERLESLIPRFIGDIQQRPPAFSALRVAGRRAYELARQGEIVQLKPRTVRVYGIELLDFTWPNVRLRIDCGRGTYIRALARDIGDALHVGGYVTQLRRTRVGDFTADHAVTLEALSIEGVEPHLLPLR